jgi:hypothetical protein
MTPVAGAPVQVNTDTLVTDSEGKIVTPLDKEALYTITTGLEAIAFDPILGTGDSLSLRSPVTIEARRLITSPEDPCRVFIDGTPNVYFSSVNTTDRVLSVPLSYSSLNQILSVTGQAAPPEYFAAGTSGFSVPESYFTDGVTLRGVWKFLGQDITVKPDIRICADRGIPGACQLVDPARLRIVIEFTRRTILRLTTESIDAARSGRWKPDGGGFRVPFLSRGARALADMQRFIPRSQEQAFACEIVPLSCTVAKVPKRALLKSFSLIFSGKIPKGLEHISRQSKREMKAFERLLKKVPDSYVTCDTDTRSRSP